ncbi:MAG: PDDEXK nuclease domain-containing protein [Candidatus Omnitrophota bacterium]
MTKSIQSGYHNLIKNIGDILARGRHKAYVAVNNILVTTYWHIGKEIVDFEQHGSERADYGSDLLSHISRDLSERYGKGFSRSNVYIMRQFYLKYPKIQTLSGKLSWSHFVELLGVTDDLARGFYEKQCLRENWSVRELSRQINAMLFERLALSKDKKAVMALSKSGHVIEKDADIVKEPYVLEFLKIPQSHAYSEKELEQRIIDNLQMFLLELGKGFAFVGRQYRISFRNKHYYIDLVFYHRILKCFVLVDLKIGNVDHLDVGQMNMYLNYFKKEEMALDDKGPIGIILAADKDEVLVEYALGGISNKLFVSKYQLYLPDKKQLQAQLRKLI